MANLQCSVQSAGTDGITATTLSAATEKCLIILTAPTNQRLKLIEFGISFGGTSSTAAPVQVVLARASSAGTTTAYTPILLGVGSETPQATAGVNASANPTKGSVLWSGTIHPQGGMMKVSLMGSEVLVPGGGRVALYAKAAAEVTCEAYLNYEE